MFTGSIQFHKAPIKTTNYIVLQEEVIGSLSACAEDTVRSLAFSVLVASPSPVRPFSAMALDILQSHMEILYADTDAKFRTDVLSNTRKMIERLRGTTAYLNKELRSLSLKHGHDVSSMSREESDLHGDILKLLRKHEDFIEWYMEFLLKELIPTVSYQRHITALKAIGLLLQSDIPNCYPTQPPKAPSNATIWHYGVDFFTARSMRLLLDLLVDPFEDVRGSAAAVLKLAPIDKFTTMQPTNKPHCHKPRLLRMRDELQLHETDSANNRTSGGWSESADRNLGLLTSFISRAEELSKRTGRADYADGVARCYELLYSLLPSATARLKLVTDLVSSLERKIHIAEQDLAQAVLDAPVHGTFAALK